jgi:hypothetical protein
VLVVETVVCGLVRAWDVDVTPCVMLPSAVLVLAAVVVVVVELTDEVCSEEVPLVEPSAVETVVVALSVAVAVVVPVVVDGVDELTWVAVVVRVPLTV